MTKASRLGIVGLALGVAVGGVGLVLAQVAGDNNRGADLSPKPPVVAKTAAEQAKTFGLPAGFRMEPVLSDPDIVSPAVIEWDGNGRMYVAEFRTYMPNVDGVGQREPANPISRWEDTDGDGTYDKHTVFADKLVLPRFVLPLQDGVILTNETDSDDVIKLSDTNGDGVADRREVFYSGVGLNRDGNLEHMQSGFIWALDNWIYSTYNTFRFRWTPGGILREASGGGGQWGLTQDDDGKVWNVCAGCERGPVNFQVPIHYGNFRIDARADMPFGEYEPNFDIVWPLPSLADVQGGMGRVRMPIGAVNHATATNGPAIVRGHRVPEDLVGDLLYAEPVGRLVRRAKIVKNQGLTQLRNAYPFSEFILSSDPLFRPVNIRTAPDGSIYIVDMYHGIIQEAEWAGPGSYLRMKIQQYQLEKITAHGRIWRLRYDGTAAVPGTPVGPAASRPIPPVPETPAIALDLTRPRMYAETAAQLVAHLSHPNGWWRDTAQRLLVLKQDKTVVPALVGLAKSSTNLPARFHALWTLEGLNALEPALVRELMKDAEPRMRIQAIRASETLFKAGNKSFDVDYRDATRDADPDVAIQAMLTLRQMRVSDANAVITATMAANKALGVQEIGRLALAAPPPGVAAAGGRGGPLLTPAQQQLMERGETIYREVCFSCHGDDGRGTPVTGGAPGTTMAPPLAGSAHVQGHRDFVVKTILHGLTGPNNGRTYAEVMIPMRQTDDWVAAVGSFVRNSFGNTAGFIAPADVARVRAASGNRRASWTVAEIESTLPVLLQPQPAWKFSASHASGMTARALTTQGWTPGVPAETDMWFQVELPEPVMLAEVQYTVPAGRGGGARQALPSAAGAAPAAPAGPAAAPAAAANDVNVLVSMDGRTWSKPVGSAVSAPLTTIAFTPVRAKFVRITRATPGPSWMIQTLRLYQAPAAQPAR